MAIILLGSLAAVLDNRNIHMDGCDICHTFSDRKLGFDAVPCKVIDVDDDTAMGMVYTINQEREEYSLQENVWYATLLFEHNKNITTIAEKMRMSRRQVRSYLDVNKLPKKYQQYLWSGKFGIGHILEMSSLFNGGSTPTILKHLDVVLERKLSQNEFRQYLHPHLKEVERKRVESAKKAVGKITAEVKEPESSEEFEKAAQALKAKAKELKSSEEKYKEIYEKAHSSMDGVWSKLEKAKKLGVDVTGFQRGYDNACLKLEPIPNKSTIEEANEVFLEAKNLKKDLDKAIAEEKKRVEEEKRKKREEQIREAISKVRTPF